MFYSKPLKRIAAFLLSFSFFCVSSWGGASSFYQQRIVETYMKNRIHAEQGYFQNFLDSFISLGLNWNAYPYLKADFLKTLLKKDSLGLPYIAHDRKGTVTIYSNEEQSQLLGALAFFEDYVFYMSDDGFYRIQNSDLQHLRLIDGKIHQSSVRDSMLSKILEALIPFAQASHVEEGTKKKRGGLIALAVIAVLAIILMKAGKKKKAKSSNSKKSQSQKAVQSSVNSSKVSLGRELRRVESKADRSLAKSTEKQRSEFSRDFHEARADKLRLEEYKIARSLGY